jgi:uncharacterized lipoprotein YajG
MLQYFNSRHLICYLPMLASSLVLAACAVNPADAQSSTPARTAQARQACATTMGLNPANADYDMCVASLLQTIAGLDQATLVERDRRACMQRGLQPNTREFALCVVDAEQVASN